jgi:hypothetical protein
MLEFKTTILQPPKANAMKPDAKQNQQQAQKSGETALKPEEAAEKPKPSTRAIQAAARVLGIKKRPGVLTAAEDAGVRVRKRDSLDGIAARVALKHLGLESGAKNQSTRLYRALLSCRQETVKSLKDLYDPKNRHDLNVASGAEVREGVIRVMPSPSPAIMYSLTMATRLS